MHPRPLSGDAPRHRWLPFVLVPAWIVGASASARVGLWLAVGGTAIVLGLLGLALEWTSLRPLLKVTPSVVVAGLLVGVGMIVATYPLYRLLLLLVPQIARDTVRLYLRLGAPSPSSLALVPSVVGEEVVWRGVIQGALVHRFRTSTAVVFGAIVYALAQSPVGSPVLVFAALICGLVWGSVRATTNSLIAAIVAHLLWSGAVLLLVPLAPT